MSAGSRARRHVGLSAVVQRDARTGLAQRRVASAPRGALVTGSMVSVSAACRLREWDSTFFGFPIGEIHASTVEELIAADAWAERERIRCLYLLVSSENFSLVQDAEARGFRLTG